MAESDAVVFDDDVLPVDDVFLLGDSDDDERRVTCCKLCVCCLAFLAGVLSLWRRLFLLFFCDELLLLSVLFVLFIM